jgi:hypothetical protein
MGVAHEPVTGADQVRGIRGQAEKRLAGKGFGGGDGHVADGAKSMFGGEAGGLVQRFDRHGGDMQLIAHADPVEAQFGHVIGRGPVKAARDMGRHIRAARGGGQGQVANLLVRDDELAAQHVAVQPGRGAAQLRQRGGQIGRVQPHLSDHVPSIRDAVKQPDAVKGQDKCKIRFHSRLTIIPERRQGVPAGHEEVLQQLLAEGKKNTLGASGAPLVAGRGWCKLRHRPDGLVL